MSNYQVVESLRITIDTLQLDPRRDENHHLHGTWTSLVEMFEQQLNEAMEEIIPDVIRTIPRRIKFRNSVRTLIMEAVNKLTEDDTTQEAMVTTFGGIIPSLEEELKDFGHLFGLDTQWRDDLITYMRHQEKEMFSSRDKTPGRTLKVIGRVIKQLTDLFAIDIDSEDTSDEKLTDDRDDESDESSTDSIEEPFSDDMK